MIHAKIQDHRTSGSGEEHRNYGKVFASTHNNEKCYRNYAIESLLKYFFAVMFTRMILMRILLEQTTFINDSKPVKTCHIFQADIVHVRYCQMYSAKISVYTSKYN